MFNRLFIVVLLTSSFSSGEKRHLGRPCRKNHCDDQHVCVRRKDVDFQFRCVPKVFFYDHPEKLVEWNLIDENRCRSCLGEPLSSVCGTDGRTYRSSCFVEYLNCFFDSNVEIECHRGCPCNDATIIKNNVDNDPLADGSADDPRGYFNECSRSTHRQLRNRFFDWFHQMKPMKVSDDLPRNNPLISIDECHPVVFSMFFRLDLSKDFELNDDELNEVEHLKNENCTEMFFKRCDQRDDSRWFIDEWCQCFANALLPCEFHNAELEKIFWNQSVEQIFRPRCSPDGYFASRQCNVETPRQCWCVNKHGIELEQTRTLDDHLLDCHDSEEYLDLN